MPEPQRSGSLVRGVVDQPTPTVADDPISVTPLDGLADAVVEVSPASRYLDSGGPLAGAPADGLGEAVLKRPDRFHPSSVDAGQINIVHRLADGRHHYLLKADDGLMDGQTAHELLASRLVRRVDHQMFVPTRAADGPGVDRPRLLVMDASDRYPASSGWRIVDHQDRSPASVPTDRAEALRLHLTDYAAGNTDRHLGNLLEAHNTDGRVHLVAIDHGACFGVADHQLGMTRGADTPYVEWADKVGRQYHLEDLVGRAYGDLPESQLRADVSDTIDRLTNVDVDSEAHRVVDGVLRGRGTAPGTDGIEASGWLIGVGRAAEYWKTRVGRLKADQDSVVEALLDARRRT